MLDALSPARRRFVAGAVLLAVLAGAAIAVAVALAGRDEPVEPVSQATPGPVLLVPGYGGSRTALEVLAGALRAQGRDASVVRLSGDGTGDLGEQAEVLDEAAEAALERTGAGSVDVVGFSAGGVIARLWVADHGGGSVARRVVTLGSPHHGTDLAGLASDLAPDRCPEACRQLAPNSDLLRALNAGDETPPGPEWVSIWTTDDRVVVPADSAAIDGAVGYPIQSVCPGLVVAHGDLPRTPAVVAATLAALGRALPERATPAVCAGR